MGQAHSGVRLTLYGRRDCHLCDAMQAGLTDIASDYAFAVDVVDVDAAAELAARYGERVPVLTHGDTELCHYFLDRAAVTAYLAAHSSPFR